MVVIDCENVDTVKPAVEAIKDSKPVLNGANASNYEAMNAVATAAGVTLGVRGADLSELHDTVAALEKAGNKNLVLDVTGKDAKETYGNASWCAAPPSRTADRTFGYPSIVNLSRSPPAISTCRTAPPSSP